MTEDVIGEAREAWSRIKGSARKNWDDWLAVGRALVVGRTEALKSAGTNRPVGTRYNRAMSEWLILNGLDISTSERYNILQIIEHFPSIEAWRNGLTAEQQRRYNSPSCVLNYWKRATKAATAPRHMAEARRATRKAANGRPVFWSQDALRRAVDAMRESRSTDWLILAKRALEAAVRDQEDVAALIDEPRPRKTKAPAEICGIA
jgi:hypothetical protein